MKIVALVQARMGSTRLPGKVMKLVDGIPLIQLLFERLSVSKCVDKIVLVTPKDNKNTPLVECIKELGYEVFQGSENDVLDRYYQAAKKEKATAIVRITGDCPLIDPEIVDQLIKLFYDTKVDYASNTIPPSYPDGLDVSICTFDSLKLAWEKAETSYDREHVMPFIRNSKAFTKTNLASEIDHSSSRWTIDEPEDYKVIKNIFNHFSPDHSFGWKEVLELEKSQPSLFLPNKNIIRNEGALMGSGQKLWKRAKKVIPGGNMLLSKRPEMFLPEKWPSYFSKSKGCKVWDLDGREYIDMSIMGIGTNILGYGHPEVDEAVKKTVVDGNMSTLNCPEEVYLAEKLIELHPWADMARFARSGGEINSIAVRIARAYTGRDKIAICGYHGWHDWYLSTNLNSKEELDKHLMPGLKPNGVPKGLLNSTIPFDYNNIDQLEQILKNNHGEIAAIKMEVSRNEAPKDGYLQKVRDLATENNIVLIFDECTSGFRETFGGLHKKYDVEPDMAVFAKALGNGYAISACIGRKKIMEAAQSTFISSTFWTERIGPSAALATLEVMERERSWEKITRTGNQISQHWRNLASKYDLPIRVFGLPALIKFSIDTPDSLIYKTLITQEMLSRGYLAGNSVYVCTEHTPDVVENYIKELESVFKVISECKNTSDLKSLLKGPVCHSEFKRLN